MNKQLKITLAICSFAVASLSNCSFASNNHINQLAHTPSTSFSLGEHSAAMKGVKFCKKYKVDYKNTRGEIIHGKCIPIKNSSRKNLWVQFGHQTAGTPAPKGDVVADINYDNTAGNDNIKIFSYDDFMNNPKTAKALYTGTAINKIGLKCHFHKNKGHKNKNHKKIFTCNQWR